MCGWVDPSFNACQRKVSWKEIFCDCESALVPIFYKSQLMVSL
jgi:hypothetical protein